MKSNKDMLEACKYVQIIRDRGLKVGMVGVYQLKSGKANFYWTTGKITIDGFPPISKVGIEAFIEILKMLERSRQESRRY